MDEYIRDIMLNDGVIIDMYRIRHHWMRLYPVEHSETNNPVIEGEAIRYEYREPEYYQFIIKVHTSKIVDKPKFLPTIRDMDFAVTTGRRMYRPNFWKWLFS